MIVQPITEQIKEWTATTDLSTKEQAKLARMQAFQQLTNLERYIRDEVEQYKSIKEFVELLRVMGVLCYPQLSIQNMEGTFVRADEEKGWENEWIFEFDVNGKEAEFSLPPPKSAEFFNDILIKFNQIINQHGFASEFHRLNVIGDLLEKSTIEIALLSPDILKKMQARSS